MRRDDDFSGKFLGTQHSSTVPSKALTPELDLARPGITTYRWRLTHAEILIEVFADGRVSVNGEPVAPFVPDHSERST